MGRNRAMISLAFTAASTRRCVAMTNAIAPSRSIGALVGFGRTRAGAARYWLRQRKRPPIRRHWRGGPGTWGSTSWLRAGDGGDTLSGGALRAWAGG
jgi:hypothetical protein